MPVHTIFTLFGRLLKKFQIHSNIHLRLLGTGDSPLLLPHFENVSYSILPYYNTQQMIDEILENGYRLIPVV